MIINSTVIDDNRFSSKRAGRVFRTNCSALEYNRPTRPFEKTTSFARDQSVLLLSCSFCVTVIFALHHRTRRTIKIFNRFSPWPVRPPHCVCLIIFSSHSCSMQPDVFAYFYVFVSFVRGYIVYVFPSAYPSLSRFVHRHRVTATICNSCVQWYECKSYAVVIQLIRISCTRRTSCQYLDEPVVIMKIDTTGV
jgi:hypothetical protein